MFRKTIQHGPSTLIISLPSNWVKANNITKGQDIQVTEQQNTLVLSTQRLAPTRSTSINISELDRTSIIYCLRSLYRSGYDEIHLSFDKERVLHERTQQKISIADIIIEETNNLIGAEVINQNTHSITIKEIASVDETSFDKMLRRVFTILSDAANTYLEACNDNNLHDQVEHKHTTLTRFTSYTLRLLNKHQQNHYLYHTILNIDKIMDFLKYNNRELALTNTKISPQTTHIVEQVVKHIKSYEQLFFKFSTAGINEIEKARNDIKQDILNSTYEGIEGRQLGRLEAILEIILDLSEAAMAIHSRTENDQPNP